jgi:hypothetical protein
MVTSSYLHLIATGFFFHRVAFRRQTISYVRETLIKSEEHCCAESPTRRKIKMPIAASFAIKTLSLRISASYLRAEAVEWARRWVDRFLAGGAKVAAVARTKPEGLPATLLPNIEVGLGSQYSTFCMLRETLLS